MGRWGSYQDVWWIRDVYVKIDSIYKANRGDRYVGGGMAGKMVEESMETEWYAFREAMCLAFEKFYSYIPEKAGSASVLDMWREKGFREDYLENQAHIALNETYGTWLGFVNRVDGKEKNWELHRALNELRPLYKKQQARFDVFTEKRKMGLPEWEAREAKRAKEREEARTAQAGGKNLNVLLSQLQLL